MSSKKRIWAGMDLIEGKEVGSTFRNVKKEHKRQGLKMKL